jgi:hypothetical protein
MVCRKILLKTNLKQSDVVRRKRLPPIVSGVVCPTSFLVRRVPDFRIRIFKGLPGVPGIVAFIDIC